MSGAPGNREPQSHQSATGNILLVSRSRRDNSVSIRIAELETESFLKDVCVSFLLSRGDQVKLANLHGLKYALANIVKVKNHTTISIPIAVKQRVVLEHDDTKIGLNPAESDPEYNFG